MRNPLRHIAACSILALPGVCAAQAQFIPLGALSGGQSSTAVGVNDDGTVVVGYVNPITLNLPVRWTVNPQPVIAAIGLPTGLVSGGAMSVSDSGDVVLGWQQQVTVFTPFRWAAPGPSVALPIPGGWSSIRPRSVSPDGVFTVGSANIMFGTTRAIRWMGVQQPTLLEMLPGATLSRAVVADSSAATYGTMRMSDGIDRLVRWTPGGSNASVLAFLPSGNVAGTPMRVSLDGARIVGVNEDVSALPFTGQPWLWTQSGFLTIPNLPGASRCIPTGMADDGSTIVGFCETGIAAAASGFVWSPGAGTREIGQVLSSLGALFPNWTLETVTGISRDGRAVIGNGLNPAGVSEAWIALIPPLCYPDCNGSGTLNVADFGCFQTKFVAGDPYADCNADGSLTVADFGCFQTRFVAGCP